jgi:D-cysteine desulfhydrase
MHKLERLSRQLGGPEIFIKRDDLTESAVTGNKIRKLEFSFAQAAEEGADTVITCGGLQSNHCRAAAILAARLGLRAILVLRGEKPCEPVGNVLLGFLAGARLRYITPEEYERRDEIMANVASEVADAGGSAYVIPEGASNEVGAWGYISAVKEIKAQCKEAGLEFDALVHPIGSAGTTAGLLLGSTLFGFSIPLMAVSVCDDAERLTRLISGIMGACIERYGLDIKPDTAALEILDNYVGPGYAVPYPEAIDTIKLLARTEGIFLDPVYTGKAFWALIDGIKKGRFKKGQKVLFLHTGGIYGLLAQNTVFGWDSD